MDRFDEANQDEERIKEIKNPRATCEGYMNASDRLLAAGTEQSFCSGFCIEQPRPLNGSDRDVALF